VPSSPACTCLSCPAHDRVQNTPCPVYPTSSITDAQLPRRTDAGADVPDTCPQRSHRRQSGGQDVSRGYLSVADGQGAPGVREARSAGRYRGRADCGGRQLRPVTNQMARRPRPPRPPRPPAVRHDRTACRVGYALAEHLRSPYGRTATTGSHKARLPTANDRWASGVRYSAHQPSLPSSGSADCGVSAGARGSGGSGSGGNRGLIHAVRAWRGAPVNRVQGSRPAAG